MAARTTPSPVVFMFQPKRFTPVKANALKDWEKRLKERVGARVAARGLSTAIVDDGGTCCVSHCPDEDDCDID